MFMASSRFIGLCISMDSLVGHFLLLLTPLLRCFASPAEIQFVILDQDGKIEVRPILKLLSLRQARLRYTYSTAAVVRFFEDQDIGFYRDEQVPTKPALDQLAGSSYFHLR